MNEIVPEEEIGHHGFICKFLISISGTLLCFSFGMMLGWPSPTYPSLLEPSGIIPITLDQTAMVAGMLMNGYVISTPFAVIKCINNKFSLITASAITCSGWIILYFSTNVMMLCISRFAIGFGSGYGMEKYRFYLLNIKYNQFKLILDHMSLIVASGVVTSFVVGPFVSFRIFAIMAAIVPAVSFITFIFVPKSIKRVSKINNIMEDGLRIKRSTNLTIFQILRDPNKRKYLGIVTFIMTVQQFTGSPALIVYSQLIFQEFGYSYPYLFSMAYVLFYLIFTWVGIKYTYKFKRKTMLILSISFSLVLSVLHAVFLYFKPEVSFVYFSFISMCIYVCFHTVGLTIVPGLIVNDLFPDNCKYTVSCFVKMYTAELAVIVTKVFQVMFGLYGMYTAFMLFSAVGCLGLMFVLCCFSETRNVLLNQ